MCYRGVQQAKGAVIGAIDAPSGPALTSPFKTLLGNIRRERKSQAFRSIILWKCVQFGPQKPNETRCGKI